VRPHGKTGSTDAMPRDPMPERIVPMLARLSKLPADDGGWAYEIKWDGVRAIAYVDGGALRLESRNLNDVTARYPEVGGLPDALEGRAAVLDGEVVAFDERGRPSFERLQGRMHLTTGVEARARRTPVAYVAFDLLWLDGENLMRRPYSERRDILGGLGLEGPAWRVPGYSTADGERFQEASAAQGLEGIMCKRLDSPYEPGRRSGAWLKVKNTQRQELVIGGWVPGAGKRTGHLGALLVGYYEDGDLRFGGKVGTGFDQNELNRLQGLLAKLGRATTPFVGRQPERGSHFVEPDLVAEIEFTEWTSQNMLRHPSYKGLRDDKRPLDVVLEKAEEPTATPAATTTAAKAPVLRSLLGEEPRGSAEITLDGRALKLTNLDKVLYPATGFTKGQVIDYYLRAGTILLPHVRDRLLSLHRYPDGVEGTRFWEKQCPARRPGWMETAPMWSESKQENIDFCVANDLPAIVWLANFGALELHPSLALRDGVEKPTVLVFDLDPGEGAGFDDCREVALLVRGMFDQLKLQTFPKTTGSKGIQVYVPLNRDVSYDGTKPFAKAVAETLERSFPDRVVASMAKAARKNRVLVDWSQNTAHKSTVAPYSLRARERPTVSMPLTWDEVEDADAGELVFDSEAALARLDARGDLFAPVLTLQQELPSFD
jgi:bifunctional non-homologous end joining protein LigD